jgi:hypothetical protein
MTKPKRTLPPVPHPDHLRKQAKARLADMRRTMPSARLADAQHRVASDYGYAGWAALQAEVTRRCAGPAGRRAFVRRVHLALLTRGGADADDDETQPLFVRAGAVAQIAFLLAVLAGVGTVIAMIGGGWSFAAPLSAHHRAAR